VAVSVFLGGCGGGSEVVPVRGTVTFNGGPPPAAGTVSFSVIQSFGDVSARPAAAPFQADGKYEVQAFPGRLGLAPGRYAVAVECSKTPLTISDDGYIPESFVPKKFRNPATSGLVIEVPLGSRSQTFDIPIVGSSERP
jgi:hypothetical protein